MAEKMLNINLEHGKRKRFTIDGDENRILELNTSDMGIFARFDEFEKESEKAVTDFAEFQASQEDFDLSELGRRFTELDKFLRDKLDYLFDTNFSAVVAPFGTMVDPIDGEFRFTYLIDVMGDVINGELTKEVKARNAKIREHTKKYVNKVNKE